MRLDVLMNSVWSVGALLVNTLLVGVITLEIIRQAEMVIWKWIAVE